MKDLFQVSNAYNVPVNRIEPNPFQPRQSFPDAELEELANSITEHGLLQPILVRPHPNKRKASSGWFQLVSGERRWRASISAGLSHIPALVRELTDLQTREIALQENIQRQDLTDWEEALALDALWKAYEATGKAMSKREIARRLNVSPTYISNRLDTLGYHPEVQQLLSRHRNVLKSAEAINHVPDATRREHYIALVDNGYSYARLTKTIDSDNAQLRAQQEANRAPDPETRQRHTLQQSQTGGAGTMSRGKLVTGGPTRTEAREQLTRATQIIEAWLPYASDADFKKLQDLARRILRGDLARGL
jgi:ParB family chromosome partitioning protein